MSHSCADLGTRVQHGEAAGLHGPVRAVQCRHVHHHHNLRHFGDLRLSQVRQQMRRIHYAEFATEPEVLMFASIFKYLFQYTEKFMLILITSKHTCINTVNYIDIT